MFPADSKRTWMTFARDTGRNFAEIGRKTRKLEREHGALTFVLRSADESLFERLLVQKEQQYKRTGARNILKEGWIRNVLHRVAATHESDLDGMVSVLLAGEQPVSIHLGMRSAGMCHSWFQVYDPAFHKYSPSLVLLLKLVEQACDAGIEVIDLGDGEYAFKRMLANHSEPIASGTLVRPSLTAAAAHARTATIAALRRTRLTRRVGRLVRQVARSG